MDRDNKSEVFEEEKDDKHVFSPDNLTPGGDTISLIRHPFNPADIDISNKVLTVDLLVARMRQSPAEIDLNTASYFQRSGNLWSIEKQSQLIESILLRFPLPAFYFDGTNNKKWLVVDGLQRLTCLYDFIVTQKLKLTGMEFLAQLEGKKFEDLNRDLQRDILETQLTAFIINPGTPGDVKFNIFKRINTGGLVLNSQEIRHALHQGVPADFLAELAELESFKQATKNVLSSNRMEDRALVNRFLALYLLDPSEMGSDIEAAMDNALTKLATISESKRVLCREAFDRAMNLSAQLFGKYAFRKWHGEKGRKNPLNKALFDVLAVELGKLSSSEVSNILQQKQIFLEKFWKLLEDNDFNNAISAFTGDPRRIIVRLSKVRALLQSQLKENL